MIRITQPYEKREAKSRKIQFEFSRNDMQEHAKYNFKRGLFIGYCIGGIVVLLIVAAVKYL